MFTNFLRRRKKPPSQGLTIAYEAARQQLITWLCQAVREWEKQPVQHRKRQLIFFLTGLLLLGSLSVYWTATGRFITHIHSKHYEQHVNYEPFRRK